MQTGIWIALLTMLAGAPLAAVAQTTQIENGVTVLRGAPVGKAKQTDASAADPTAASNGGSPVQSGNTNAVGTGSANAGGEVANPPPGLGR